MIGLVFVIGGLFYVLLIILATRWAFRWAKGKGFPKGKSCVIAALGFMLANLPIFWDSIPTIVANWYYCSSEAGFSVFKTIDQWKVENPGTAERLTWKDISPDEVLANGTRRYLLNERMVWEARKRSPIPFISTTLNEDLIVDQKTGQILAKRLGVGSGYSNPIVAGNDWRGFKFWLTTGRCSPMLMEFSQFQIAAKQLGEKK